MIPPFLLSILKGQLQDVFLDGKATSSVPGKGLSDVKQGDIIEGRIVGHKAGINFLDCNGERLKVRSQVELPIGAKVRLRVSNPSTPVEVKLEALVEDGGKERLQQSEKEMARLEASFSRIKGLVGRFPAMGPEGEELSSNANSNRGIDSVLKALGISGTTDSDDIKALALLQQKGMGRLLRSVADSAGIDVGSEIQEKDGVGLSGGMFSAKASRRGITEAHGNATSEKVRAEAKKAEGPPAILRARRMSGSVEQGQDSGGAEIGESFLDQGVKDAKAVGPDKALQAQMQGIAEEEGLVFEKDSKADASPSAFSKKEVGTQAPKHGSTGRAKGDGAILQEASTKTPDSKGPRLDDANQTAKAQEKALAPDSNGPLKTYLPKSEPIDDTQQVFLKIQKQGARDQSFQPAQDDEKALAAQSLVKDADATQRAPLDSRPQHNIQHAKIGQEPSPFHLGTEKHEGSKQGPVEQHGQAALTRHSSSAKDMDGVLIREFSNHVDVANQIQHHVFKETGQQLFIFPLLFTGLEGAGQWSFWKEQEEGHSDMGGQDTYHITFDLYMKSLGQLNIHILQKEERLSLYIGAEKERLPVVREGLSDVIGRIKALGYRFETINCYCLEEEQIQAVSSMPLDQGEASRFHLIT